KDMFRSTRILTALSLTCLAINLGGCTSQEANELAELKKNQVAMQTSIDALKAENDELKTKLTQAGTADGAAPQSGLSPAATSSAPASANPGATGASPAPASANPAATGASSAPPGANPEPPVASPAPADPP